jgi:hypothetical protein
MDVSLEQDDVPVDELRELLESQSSLTTSTHPTWCVRMRSSIPGLTSYPGNPKTKCYGPVRVSVESTDAQDAGNSPVRSPLYRHVQETPYYVRKTGIARAVER